MVITRVDLKRLKSAKQLRKLSFQKVVSAGFTDETENCFEIEFEMPNGTYRDLAICFDEGEGPQFFVSKSFKYGQGGN